MSGGIRFRGEGNPLLIGLDVHPEIQQEDGTWTPLRTVRSAVIRITPDGLVTAEMEMLVDAIDLTGVTSAVDVDRRERIACVWCRARADEHCVDHYGQPFGMKPSRHPKGPPSYGEHWVRWVQRSLRHLWWRVKAKLDKIAGR